MRLTIPSRVRAFAGPCVLTAFLLMAGDAGWCAELSTGPSSQQTQPADVKPRPVTPEDVQARLKRVEEDTSLEAQAKTKLVELYKKALEQLALAEKAAGRTAQLKAAREKAPEHLSELKKKLDEPAPEPQPQVPEKATLADLDRELTKVEGQWREARQSAADLGTELSKRSGQQSSIPKDLASAKKRLAEVTQELAAKPGETEPAEQRAARQTFLEAQQKAVTEEIAALEEELSSHQDIGDVLTARRDLAVREAARLEKLKAAWDVVVKDRREKEARRQLAEARRAKATAHPAVKQLADANEELSQRRKQLGPKIETVAKDLDEAVKAEQQHKKDFGEIAERIKAVGLTTAVGLSLRKRQTELPDVRRLSRRLRDHEAELASVQFALFDIREEMSRLANVEQEVEAFMRQPSVRPEDAADGDEIRTAAKEQFDKRREYLETLKKDYDAYFQKLLNLCAAERLLVATVLEYDDFLDEHVLWIRSEPPLGQRDADRLGAAAAWLGDPANWLYTAETLWAGLTSNVAANAFVAIILVGLFVRRRRHTAQLEAIGKRTAPVETDRFALTLQALLLTVLVAIPWPLVMGFVAWRLDVAAGTGDFAKAVAGGLRTTALFAIAMETLRQLLRPEGVADKHFRWRLPALRFFRHKLLMLMGIVLPAVFLVAATEASDVDDHRRSLGRAAFIVGMVVVSVFAKRAVAPSGTVMKGILSRSAGGWLDRLRYVWYPLAVLSPLALALLTGLGYYYTALELQGRLSATIVYIFVLLAAHATVVRWLFVVRRRLAVQQARARREQQLVEAKQAGVAAPPDTGPVLVDEPTMNLATMDAQTRHLLRSVMVVAFVLGLWAVWVDVLPALGILSQIQLWVADRVNEKDVWITMESLVLAGIVLILTVVAAKNIPGLLEIAVLRQLPLDPGGRYAVTTVSKYVIMMVGMIAAFGVIGIGWSTVQWLMAAMSVGLGFGLQEIFANFISGLIILFERPIRVGDAVTIGGVSGTVTRIRIRATTITDWNRRELIVPNKEFVTGQLINWSLSDSILRVDIPVGIAYGSDTTLAKTLLLTVACEQRHVLPDPAPQAVFLGFGDSSLSFELRVFIPNYDVRISVQDELHMAIDQAFRKAGVEIAFPQRDVHVRSIRAALPVGSQTPQAPAPD